MFLGGLLELLGSKTLAMAITLIPLLGRAHESGQSDSWIYSKLPDKYKKNGTAEELNTVFSTGKAFIAAIWAFLH